MGGLSQKRERETRIIKEISNTSKMMYNSFEYGYIRLCYGRREIKSSQTRIMYVVINQDGVAFLHICKKQKGKAEKLEIDKAIRRAKREGLL